ncbi:hypothetical protein [Anaerospora hongkongensis]
MGLINVSVANLSTDQVQALKKYEQEFASKYGSNVIFIAFNDKN